MSQPRKPRPPRPVVGWRTRVEYGQLSQSQRNLVSAELDRLGMDEGLLEDSPKVDDPAERQWVSARLAEELGLSLATWHEIGQCNYCLAVMDRSEMEEDSDRLFCHSTIADCLLEAQAEDEAPPQRFAA